MHSGFMVSEKFMAFFGKGATPGMWACGHAEFHLSQALAGSRCRDSLQGFSAPLARTQRSNIQLTGTPRHCARSLVCCYLLLLSVPTSTLWNASCSQLLISAVDRSYSVIGIDDVDNVQDIGCRDHDQNAGGGLTYFVEVPRAS